MRRRLLPSSLALLLLGARPPAPEGPGPGRETSLPELGTQLAPLPRGPGKALAEKDCLRCHSSDILRQQRLTEKQWTAVINKMIGWGSEVPELQKAALIAYLTQHFGPDNDHFIPVAARVRSRH